jgi:predicted CopG family antitoxin
MPATTIKLESDLAQKASDLKQEGQSISAFVRSLIEREHRSRRLQESAQAYEHFLRDHPEEREAMEVWESAPLSETSKLKQP